MMVLVSTRRLISGTDHKCSFATEFSWVELIQDIQVELCQHRTSRGGSQLSQLYFQNKSTSIKKTQTQVQKLLHALLWKYTSHVTSSHMEVTGVSSLLRALQGERVLKGYNEGTTRVERCYVWITMTTKMLQMCCKLLFLRWLAHNSSPHFATPSDVPVKLRRHAHETHIQMRSCVWCTVPILTPTSTNACVTSYWCWFSGRLESRETPWKEATNAKQV